jgi:ubiquinone biosynthesis UbiH/UbiF/VisC/COQ6 family hydroxylase
VEIDFECKVDSITRNERGYRLQCTKGSSLSTPLLVAADSRYSSIRSQAGIGADMNDFARIAIVCRMKHRESREPTAFECFHYGHTLAILPHGSHESSIVVTASTERANQMMSLDDDGFCQFVGDAFCHRLGDMTPSSERFTYPLIGVHARQFVAEHFALIGDAAVGMHPVTAHGFNLGLSSAHLLATEVTAARDKGRAYYTEQVLKAYQKKHIRETRIMYYGTNGIVNLFTDDRISGRFARKAVLGLSRRCPPIRWAIEHKLTDQALSLKTSCQGSYAHDKDTE